MRKTINNIRISLEKKMTSLFLNREPEQRKVMNNIRNCKKKKKKKNFSISKQRT